MNTKNNERALSLAVYLVVLAVAVTVFGALLEQAVPSVNRIQRDLLQAQERWHAEVQLGWKSQGVNSCVEYVAGSELPVDVECNTLALRVIPAVVIGGLLIASATIAAIVVTIAAAILYGIAIIAAIFLTQHFPSIS